MDKKTKNKMPMTVIAISAKKPSSDSGMEHLKYLHDQMAETTDEAELKNLKEEIKEWSSVMVKQYKAKSETKAEAEAEGEEEMAEGEEEMAEGEEEMAEGEEEMAEGEEEMAEGEEYPKKKKKKVVSLMDLFNPSRPLGMR